METEITKNRRFWPSDGKWSKRPNTKTAHENVENGPCDKFKTAQTEVQNGQTLIRITYTYAVG